MKYEREKKRVLITNTRKKNQKCRLTPCETDRPNDCRTKIPPPPTPTNPRTVRIFLRVHVVSLFEVFVFGVRIRQVVVFALRAPSGARVTGQETGEQRGQTRGEHGRQHRLHGVTTLLALVHPHVVVVRA